MTELIRLFFVWFLVLFFSGCDGGHDSSSESNTRITFNALPDTGQTESYTDIFGEDSDYNINPPSYTKLNDTGTALGDNAASWSMVRDNITGLVWQQATRWDDWDSALMYCKNLTLGGYTDWRLPTIMELSTLVNAGMYKPLINEEFFDIDFDYEYWSSTTNVRSTSFVWHVDFCYGNVNHSHKAGPENFRAVRGGQ